MVGQVVEVHTTDGAITKGLFVSRTDPECTEVEPGIILSCTYFMRSEVHNALDKANFDPAHKKFAYKDIMFMEAENLKVRTDIPITAQRQQYRGEHDLKAIDFTEDVKCEVLEDESHHLGHWDQFEENKKFGVKSTFNEELYTTKLDHNKFTKEQFETAEKIAREIERGPTHGIMHRVERNEIALESEDDALYSDVTRMDGRKAHSPNMMNNNVNSARSPNRTSSPRGMVNNGSNNINSSRKNESKIASASSTSGSAKRSAAPIPHTVMKDGPSSSPRSPPTPTSSTSQTNTKITPAELEGGSSSSSSNKANTATATVSHSVSAAIQTANGEINNTNRTSSNNATPGHASESRKITVIDDFLKTIADAITHNQDNYNNSAEWPGAGNSYDEDDSYYSADAHRNEAYMSSAIHHNNNNNVNVGAGGALPYSSRNVNEMNSNPMYHAHNAMMHPMSLHNTTATPANMNMNTNNNNNNMNINAVMSMMPHQHQHQHAHLAMANPTHGHVPNMGSMNANMMGATTTTANNNSNTTTTTVAAGMNVNMGAGHPTGTGVMNNTNNNNNPAFAAGMMPPTQMHHGHMHGNLNNNSSTTGVNVNANSSHNTPGSLVNANSNNTNMMPANPNVNVGGYMPHHGMNMNMNQPNMSAVNQMGYNRPNMGFVPSPQQPQPQQPSSSSSPQQLSPPQQQQQQGNMPASSLAHPSPHHQFTPNMNVGNMNPMMTSSNNNTNISGSGGTNTNTNMHMQGTPQPSNMGMPNPIPSMMPLEIPANHYQSTMAPQGMNLSSGGGANNPHTSNTMANTMNSMNMNVTHSAGNTPGSLGNHPMPSHAYMDPNINLNAAIPPSQGMLNSNTTTNNTVGGGMHMANQMNLMHPSPGPSSASRMPLPASQTRPAKGSQPQQPVSVTQSLQPNLNNTTPHPPSQQPTTTSTTSTNYSHNTVARPSSLHSSPPPASSSTSSQQPPQTTFTSTSTTTTTKGNTATTSAAAANGNHPHQPLTSSTSQNNATTSNNVVPAVDSSSSTTTNTSTGQGSRHTVSGSHASPGAQPTKQLRRGGGAGGNARSNAAAAATGGGSTSSAAESSKKKESRFTADKLKEGKVKEKDGKPLH